MNDNLNYTEYKEDRNIIPWKSIILTLIGVVLGVIIIILIFRGCAKSSLRDDLIKAGHEYYEKHPSQLPLAIGQCYEIPLSVLQNEEIVGDFKYRNCDKTMTYVNVCYLENKTYHYSANVSCKNEKTNYEAWKDGQIANLTDKSDVRFLFIGEAKEAGIKYYYPNDLKNVNQVIHYYKEAPSKDYVLKSGEKTGYKWYTETSGNSYWQNGSYSSTEPSGYPNKGQSKTETKLTITRPQTAPYRTINEVTLYRYQKIARPYKYKCSDPSRSDNYTIISDIPCQQVTNGFTKVVDMTYTCDGTKTVEIGTICEAFTNWSKEKCANSTLTGIKCESSNGYEYTDTMWKWYKTGSSKKYYPSGASSAEKENTYFIEAPTKDAIKDTSTEAQVYKFYKLVNESGSNIANHFEKLHDDYITYNELITLFKNLNYPVNELSDINKIDEIRYVYKLQYRNVEE